MKLGTLLRINNIAETDEKMKALRYWGFESCQLVYKPTEYKSEDAVTIKEAAAKYVIDISAQFCGFNDSDTIWDNYWGYMTAGLGVEAYRKSRCDYVRQAADFAHECGIEDIVIHAGFIPNNPFSNDYPPILTAVKLICDHCKNLGMNVLLETGGESAVGLLRIIEDVGTGNLFVNLDPANMLMYGYANPVDAMYTIGKYVRNIHGKDGLPPTTSRELGKETPIGEGMVDFPKLFAELKKAGYNRYITIEREITGEEQIRDILKSKKYFEKLLEEI